jgi:hypothetical protein
VWPRIAVKANDFNLLRPKITLGGMMFQFLAFLWGGLAIIDH